MQKFSYDREHLDCVPTEQGKREIRQRLGEFLRRPFEVVDHQAAVRPILDGRHPAMGLHPDYPQLAFFNGLGSKGTLQAPLLASQFAEFLTEGGTLDREVDLNRRAELRQCHA